MAAIEIEKEGNIIHAKISGALQKSDFDGTIIPAVEKILKQDNRPDCVLIDARKFEGWEDFPAFVKHMEFIRDHHQYIKKLAIEGEGKWQEMLLPLAAMISGTEIKLFKSDQDSEAKSWLESNQEVRRSA